MKKKIFIIALLCLFILTGCVKNYWVGDIKEYLEKNIGIKNYTLKTNPIYVKDDDGYTDKYWHVNYQNIEFDVIDDHRYGMESVTNSLITDFDNVVLDYYYGKYSNKESITYKKDYIYNENTLICEVADDDKNIDETKLRECFNNILYFLNTIDFIIYPVSNISVEITNSTGHVKWTNIYSNKQFKSFTEFSK